MGLLYWLPMTDGTLINKGLSNIQPINQGATVNSNGKLGKCYDFAGSTTSYINSGFKESFGTGDFSIAAWFKLTDSGSRTYQPIISNKATAAASLGCAIYYNHSQQKFLWSTADGSNSTEVWTSKQVLYNDLLNSWHHIVMIRNNSDAKKGYFYIDGERYELASVPAIRNVTNTTQSMFIGQIIAPTTNYGWTGSLCDIRIYDNALSANEVKKIAQGLVLHYPLSREGFGCENILKNSATNFPVLWSGSGEGSTLSTQSNVSVPEWGCTDALRAYGKAGAANRLVLLINDSSHGFTVPMASVDGQKYAASIYVKNNHATNPVQISFNGLQKTNFYIQPTTQQRIVMDVTGNGQGYLQFTISAQNVSLEYDFTFWHPKVELGTVATPWIPAITDPLYTKLGLDNQVVYDVSGYHHNGIKSGIISYSSDTPRHNVSTFFADYTCTIQAPIVISSPDKFTMAVWVKSTSVGKGSYQMPLNIDVGLYEFSIDSNGKFRQGFYVNGTRNVTTTESKNVLDGSWHHLAATFDGSNIKRYVDGELVDTTAASGTLSTSSMLYVGTYGTGTSYGNVNMYESDIRLYVTALSADDIMELYTTPTYLANN